MVEVRALKAEMEVTMRTNDLQELKEEQRKANELLNKIQTLLRNLVPDYHKQQLEALKKFSRDVKEESESSLWCGCIMV